MNGISPAAAGKPSVRIPSLAAISAKLESMMDVVRPFRDADDIQDVRLALGSLLLSCHDALDALAAIGGKASLEDMADAATAVRMDRAMMDHLQRVAALTLPPIAGGAPDDHEEIDEAIFGDEWPEYPDAEVDGYTWEPTPDDVLARDLEGAGAYAPTAQDWSDYSAWAALSDSAPLSEADHYAAIGCC